MVTASPFMAQSSRAGSASGRNGAAIKLAPNVGCALHDMGARSLRWRGRKVTLMRKMALPAAFAVMCSVVAALADPAGLYFVSGYNPDQTTYFGDVAVTRMDQTYRVVWNVNNQQLSGFGLGYNNSFVANCCGNNQTSLSVMEFQDGVWLGLWWDYSGARLGGEVWQAHDSPDQPTPDGPPDDLAGHYLKAGTQPAGSTFS